MSDNPDTMRWAGGASAATPIIDWMLSNGTTARFHEALTIESGGISVLVEGEHIVIDRPFRENRFIPDPRRKAVAAPGDFVVRDFAARFDAIDARDFEAARREARR